MGVDFIARPIEVPLANLCFPSSRLLNSNNDKDKEKKEKDKDKEKERRTLLIVTREGGTITGWKVSRNYPSIPFFLFHVGHLRYTFAFQF